MSQQNVEIQLKALESFARGGDEWYAWFDRFIDEHVVLRMAEGWPERVYYGKDAARSFYDGAMETIGRDVSHVEDLVDGGDRVVVRIGGHGTGEISGVEVDLEFTQVSTFRNGRMVMIEFFWDYREALEAAGLSD
jgi:ketosteroid isomerase-like protein